MLVTFDRTFDQRTFELLDRAMGPNEKLPMEMFYFRRSYSYTSETKGMRQLLRGLGQERSMSVR